MATHGLDLADAEAFGRETALFVHGYAEKDGRPRYRAIGRLYGDLVTIIFAQLGTEAISVISLRRASRAERRLYEKANS